MGSLRAEFCLLCVVLAGCGGGLAAQSGAWLQVDTNDVRLRTDLDAESAAEFAKDIQRHRDALVATSFDCATVQLTEPLRVTFFANEGQFDAVANRDARTLLEPSRDGLVELPPELLMKPTRNERLLRQAALHEIVHTLSAECYPGLPPWLSKGLPLFYETVEIEGDALVAGRQRYVFVREREMSNEISRTRDEITVVPDTAVPPLAKVLEFGFDEFFQYIDYYDTLQERDRVLLLGRYAGAWALTHALSTVDASMHARLQQFMSELRFGEAPREAWSSTMSGVDLELLYNDWTAVNVRYPMIALGFEASAETRVTQRVMSEAEVELHLATRWDWENEEARKNAIDQINRAIELEPTAPAAYLVRAALSETAGSAAEAGTWLSRALNLAPDDARVLRSELVFRTTNPSIPLDDKRDLAEVVRLLEERASTAAEYDAVARYYLEADKDTMEARYWAARALRRDPGCAPCRVTAGDVLKAAGQPALAATMYQRALNLGARDRAFDRAYVQRALAEVEGAPPTP